MTNKQSSECPTVPSWDPAQRDLSHRSFPQSLSIMLLLFSSCRESPNNFLPIVWQTWLCARCPGAINQPSLWTDTGTLAAADHWVPADTAECARGYLSPHPLLHVTMDFSWSQSSQLLLLLAYKYSMQWPPDILKAWAFNRKHIMCTWMYSDFSKLFESESDI